MKNKKVLIISILIIMIVINFLIFTLLYLYNINSKDDSNLYIRPIEKQEIKCYQYDGKLYPENNYEFKEKLNSNVDLDNIYTSIYDYVNNLYNLYSKTKNIETQNEFNDYYSKNKNDLKYKYKIINKESFIDIVIKLRQIYKDETNYFETVKFLYDTYVVKNNVECELLIIFKDNQQLNVKMVIDNNIIYFVTIEK